MVFVGVDVSSSSFNFCIIDSSDEILSSSSLSMNSDDFQSFLSLLKSFDEPIVALESSSRYHITLSSFLVSNSIPVYVINPKAISKFISFKSPNNPSKTDSKDAFFIALFIKSEHPNLKPYSQSSSVKLIARKIETTKHEIAKTKTQIKHALAVLFPEIVNDHSINIFSKGFLNLIHKYPSAREIAKASIDDINRIIYSPIGRKISLSAESIKEIAISSIGIDDIALKITLKADIEKLFFLMNQVEQLEEVFIQHMQDFFCEDIEIVSSIKGVSESLACMLIAEIGDINRFESYKKLISYAGTDPVIKQSGKYRVNMSISKQGNPHLRNILYQIATGVVMWNEVFREYFKRKYSEFKSRRKAMIAVVNKFIRIVFAMLKSRSLFHHGNLISNT